MTLRKISVWRISSGAAAAAARRTFKGSILAQSGGKDEVVATELLVLQLPLQGGWDILQHFPIHDKFIL